MSAEQSKHEWLPYHNMQISLVDSAFEALFSPMIIERIDRTITSVIDGQDAKEAYWWLTQEESEHPLSCHVCAASCGIKHSSVRTKAFAIDIRKAEIKEALMAEKFEFTKDVMWKKRLYERTTQFDLVCVQMGNYNIQHIKTAYYPKGLREVVGMVA